MEEKICLAPNCTFGDTEILGNGPRGLAVSDDNSTLYVANFLDDAVYVVNLVLDTVTTSIPVAHQPTSVVITPDRSKIYVSSESKTITEIDPDINMVVDTITTPFFPIELAITPDGSSIYVAYEVDNSVSELDTETNMIVETILVGQTPSGIAVSPDVSIGVCMGCQ